MFSLIILYCVYYCVYYANLAFFSGIPKTGASRCGVEIRGAVKGCGEVRRGAVLK